MTNLDYRLTLEELIKIYDVGGGEIKIVVKDNKVLTIEVKKKVYVRKKG